MGARHPGGMIPGCVAKMAAEQGWVMVTQPRPAPRPANDRFETTRAFLGGRRSGLQHAYACQVSIG